MAQQWADHSTPVLTARYAHVDSSDENKALAALPGVTPCATMAQQNFTDNPGQFGTSSDNRGRKAEKGEAGKGKRKACRDS